MTGQDVTGQDKISFLKGSRMTESNGKEASPPLFGPMRLATRKLIDVMSKGKPGDVLTDERTGEISERTTSVGGDGYGYLMSAIRYCLREHGVVWKRVVGEGLIECLTDPKKLSCVQAERRGVHRRTKRTMRTLRSVDSANLDDGQRKEHLVLVAVCGTLIQASSTRTVKKLTNDAAPKPLDMGRLLTAMTKSE